MQVLFFKAITPPKAPQGHSDMPAHERLRALADELERSAGQDDVAGTADDQPEAAAVDGNGDGAPDGGADLDGDGNPDPTAAPGADGDSDDMPPGGEQGASPGDEAPGGEDADATDPGADGGADGGADAEFGPHNVEPGHHVSFGAGEFNGAGKVTATGDDGCTVADKSGREHRVHWHEVKGHNDGAAAAGAKPDQPGGDDQQPAGKPAPFAKKVTP